MNNNNNNRNENGKGNFTLLENGRWRWRYSYNGKRKDLYQKKGETKKAFEKRVIKIQHDINENTYVEKNNDTLLQILERHIEQKYKDKIIEEVSYKRTLETLNQLKTTCKNFMQKPIQKVTSEDIEDAKSNIIKYSQSCIDKMWTLLKNGFKIAYSRRKINFNIMEDITLTKPISEKTFEKIEALDYEEEKNFLNLLDNELKYHKYRNIVKLQLLTGMRISEVLARSIEDYDEKENTLLIHNTLTRNLQSKPILGSHTKTYNKRTGIDTGKRLLHLEDLHEDVKNIILEQKFKKITNMHNLLFWDYEKNTFISQSEINSWLKRINNKYHITTKKFSTHVLRHTYITRLREKGVDMKIIQYLVGHVEGSSVTNDIYTSISHEFIKNELKKVANL